VAILKPDPNIAVATALAAALCLINIVISLVEVSRGDAGSRDAGGIFTACGFLSPTRSLICSVRGASCLLDKKTRRR
jgi:hypothetical protein